MSAVKLAEDGEAPVWGEANRLLHPDYIDADNTLLASFQDIRKKNLKTLYGTASFPETPAASTVAEDPEKDSSVVIDKSPKGSVDPLIRPLCDLINSHPSFCTLSSCSGRIAVFDPAHCSAVPISTMTSSQRKSRDEDDVVHTRVVGVYDEQASDRLNARPTHHEGTQRNVERQAVEHRRRSPLQKQQESGKGRGAWLLASHEQVQDMNTLSRILDDVSSKRRMTHYDNNDRKTNNDVLLFKHEPLLLHVAAANLERGRQLLDCALQLGFRESGLVVTDQRVTVAIRGLSLALVVPLMVSHSVPRPPDSFLTALLQQANLRMQLNHDKLNQLEVAVRRRFFRQLDDFSTTASSIESVGEIYCSFRRGGSSSLASLPALNLWGHASEAIAKDGNHDVYVFGGYGSGPMALSSDHQPYNQASVTFEKDTGKTTTSDSVATAQHASRCQRSSKIYRYSTKSNIWTDMTAQNPDLRGNETMTTPYGIRVRLVPRDEFTAREGLKACRLSLSSNSTSRKDCWNVICLFGGRSGPGIGGRRDSTNYLPSSYPLDLADTLLLYDPSIRTDGFLQPLDVLSLPDCPEACWAHTFTALRHPARHEKQEDLIPMALLIGGRTATKSLASVFLLSLQTHREEDDNPLPTHSQPTRRRFQWSRIDISCSELHPQYNHSVSMISSTRFVLFNGLQDPDNLLECFDRAVSPSTTNASVMCFELVENYSRLRRIPIESPVDSDSGAVVPFFGGSSCSFNVSSGTDTIKLLMATGGIPKRQLPRELSPKASTFPLIRCFIVSSSCGSDGQESIRLSPVRVKFQLDADRESLYSAPLVHHSSLCLDSLTTREVMLLGGGASSFAFRPCFSESYHFQINPFPSSSNEPLLSTSTTVRRSDTTSTTDAPPTSVEIPVLLVESVRAKSVKTLLEARGWLDKRFRMIPAIRCRENEEKQGNGDLSSKKDLIVVPITQEGVEAYKRDLTKERSSAQPESDEDWVHWIVDLSVRADLPESTAMHAAGRKQMRRRKRKSDKSS